MHYCLYCFKPFKQISTHLKAKHFQKTMVSEYLKEEKNSLQAMKSLVVIRNMGDNQHNQAVLRNKAGEIILTETPQHALTFSDFSVCKYCFAWVEDYYRHLAVRGRCLGFKCEEALLTSDNDTEMQYEDEGLALSEDLQLFNLFLKDRASNFRMKACRARNFKLIAQIVQTRLLLFNKCCPTDIQAIR